MITSASFCFTPATIVETVVTDPFGGMHGWHHRARVALMEPKMLFLLAIAAMEGTRLRFGESGKARASTETLFTIRRDRPVRGECEQKRGDPRHQSDSARRERKAFASASSG